MGQMWKITHWGNTLHTQKHDYGQKLKQKPYLYGMIFQLIFFIKIKIIISLMSKLVLYFLWFEEPILFQHIHVRNENGVSFVSI